MAEGLVARAEVTVRAPASAVWATMVDPDARWMVGARVSSSYVVGDPITFDGEWEGKSFQDHGVIQEVDPQQSLRYSHYSALSGQPDVPENYHHLTFTLRESEGSTTVTLEQDGNDTSDEREHAEGIWRQVLEALAATVSLGVDPPDEDGTPTPVPARSRRGNA